MKSFTALSQSEREESILNQLPQARLLAKRLHRRCPHNILLEDLESAGITGLIEAADRFDCARGVKFKTIAEHRIRGAMLNYLRSLDPLPRAVRRFVREREAAVALLERQGCNMPTEVQIAQTMGISVERYKGLAQAAQLAESFMIEPEEAVCPCAGPTPFDQMLLLEIANAINALPQRQRSIMLALSEGFSLTEIASRMQITIGHASYLKKQAVVRIRAAFGIAQPPLDPA